MTDRSVLSDWQKGDLKFYRALGEAGIPGLANALAVTDIYSGNDTPQTPLEFVVSADKNPVVIAVKTWNYESGISDLMTDIKPITKNNIAPPPLYSVPLGIAMNVDNVRFRREGPDFAQESGRCIVPPPVKHYAGQPGRFVVDMDTWTIDTITRKGRTYDNIISILVAAETGRGPWPVKGEGEDWVQVAATDICNANIGGINDKVFKCVWQIIAEDKDAGGVVNTATPNVMVINGYRYGKINRFNMETDDIYGFHHKTWRDNLVYHESLHAYNGMGEDVFDTDAPDGGFFGDNLVVGSADDPYLKNPYFTFTWDHKIRGYLKRSNGPFPRDMNSGDQYLWGYLNGVYGDRDPYGLFSMTFVVPLDEILSASECLSLFSGAAVDIYRPSPVPPDLTYLPSKELSDLGTVEVYIQRISDQAAIGIGNKDNLKFIDHVRGDPEFTAVSHDYGSYQCARYRLHIRNYTGGGRNDVFNYLKQYGSDGKPRFRIYLILKWNWTNHAPSEYDASMFAIKHRP
jgi:hypothetical protein